MFYEMMEKKRKKKTWGRIVLLLGLLGVSSVAMAAEAPDSRIVKGVVTDETG